MNQLTNPAIGIRAAEAIRNMAYSRDSTIIAECNRIGCLRSNYANWDKGHAPSETMVAECYLEGRGVEKDVESAMIWLRRAARKGNARAKMLLKAHESDSVREE